MIRRALHRIGIHSLCRTVERPTLTWRDGYVPARYYPTYTVHVARRGDRDG